MVQRRRFLGTFGAAASVGIAGCTSVFGGSSLDELRLAYLPIYPNMQYFVMQREGYLDEIPAEVAAESFPDGPSLLQSFASGDFDMALFGVVPAMVLMNKDVGAKLTAASNKNGMRILANEEFATLWEEEGKDAFSTWEQRKGRKFTFGTLPSGTVPDIMLRYWLREAIGVDPESAVSIEGIGGHSRVKQALLAGRVDGTSITEPVATVVLTSDAPYAEIGWSGDYMPGQPTTAVVMGQSLREEYPSVATAYLEAHERATQFIADNPMRAAAHASTVIGEESLPPETARRAIQSHASQFVVDPHAVAESAVAISEYAARLGKIDASLSESELFDYDLYEGES